MQQTDSENKYFKLAESCVNHTGRNLFLTGKAGTGKTTFLHYIKANTTKNAVVVAPTGVAAINAGGVTMHSFFQLPFTPFIPESADPQQFLSGENSAHTKHTLFNKIRFNNNKRKILRELELLIIDEASMLRADMLDAIDAILRHFRQKPRLPFGGVQLLLIGDLFQLPPVVVNNEWQVMKNYYSSPFFFHAHALREAPPLCIELKKIYRQSDDAFIAMLNKIRHNQLDEGELQELNTYYQPEFKPEADEHYITLCSHNYKARNINESELRKLSGNSEKFKAEIDGDFNEKAYPAEEILELKKGAQIMFIKNDKGEEKRYYNGKIGTIQKIESRMIWVEFPDDDTPLLLEKEEWKNIRYNYNSAQKRLDEEEIGVFRQYPIRLAWAVTIHKSQGLTFDRAVIDAGASFSPGQVYVALSRLSNKNGLVLRSVIRESSIQCDKRVLDFMEESTSQNNKLEAVLKEEQKAYIHRCINESFDWDKPYNLFKEFVQSHANRNIPHIDEAEKIAQECRDKIKLQKTPADKFRDQLNKITHSESDPYPLLFERIKAAEQYFKPGLLEIIQALKGQTERFKKERRVKKYLKEIHELTVECEHKITEIEQSRQLAEGLMQGKDQSHLLETRSEVQKNTSYSEAPKLTKQKPQKGESKKITLQYFKEGKSAEEIAEERGLVLGTIESHLISFIKTGELSVFDFVKADKVESILKELGDETRKMSEIKESLGEGYSYNEIRAVMNHHYNLKTEASES
ncbi:MAG: helix-turn-helix domain-containing protein [Chitinophagales bacterium]